MEPSDPPQDAGPFPSSGRLAAVDYGSVRIGIALCDPERILISPFAVWQRSTEEKNAKYFASLAREERIAGFIVGLPIHCDGGESDKSIEARRFARWLQKLTKIPTRLFDERFSTALAKRRLQGLSLTKKQLKGRIDAIAAQVLLEAFLEVQQYTGQIPGEAPESLPAGGEPLEG